MKLVTEANRQARRTAEYMRRRMKLDSKAVGDIVKALAKADLNINGVSVDSTGYDIHVTGSRADLDIMFGILRRAGLEPDSRPQEKQSTYSTYWRNEVLRIWVMFSSTSCKRVQVRTELQEVPVYEMVCED